MQQKTNPEQGIKKAEGKVHTFFQNLYQKHGDSHKSLAYGSQQTQAKKFQVLIEIAPLEGASILDVGCGFGDLVDYVEAAGISIDYTGVELVEEIAQVARKKHPGSEIITGDILDIETDAQYDYVLTTGFNCVRTNRNWEVLCLALEKMLAMCRKGVAAGMVSNYRHPQDESTYYASPEEVFRYCMSLTTKVILRHDYLPHDFTVYLYK